jgi:hypothetical protein
MFLIFGGFTAAYFLITVFLLPETKGRTLEEIEEMFERSVPLRAWIFRSKS